MKVGGINLAMSHKIELQKLQQQMLIKQQQVKAIKDRQNELEKIKAQDLDKGSNIDEMS
jgi:hypothetical protein